MSESPSCTPANPPFVWVSGRNTTSISGWYLSNSRAKSLTRGIAEADPEILTRWIACSSVLPFSPPPSHPMRMKRARLRRTVFVHALLDIPIF